MPRRNHHADGNLRHRTNLEPAVLDRIQQQAEVHLGRSHQFDNVAVIEDPKFEVELGIVQAGTGDRFSHEPLTESVDHGDADSATPEPAKLIKALERAVIILPPSPQVCEQQLAGCRQLHSGG